MTRPNIDAPHFGHVLNDGDLQAEWDCVFNGRFDCDEFGCNVDDFVPFGCEPFDGCQLLSGPMDDLHFGDTLSVLGIGSNDVNEGFLRSMTPLTLVIDQPESIGLGITTLLAKAEETRRGGLTDDGSSD